MSVKRVNSAFSVLSTNMEDDYQDDSLTTSKLSEHEREYRKAVKKLREITNIRERLESARAAGKLADAEPTREQQVKLSFESEWWEIINLYDNPMQKSESPPATSTPVPVPPLSSSKSNRQLQKERKVRDKKKNARLEQLRKDKLKEEYDERCKIIEERKFQRKQEEYKRLARERAEKAEQLRMEAEEERKRAEAEEARKRVETEEARKRVEVDEAMKREIHIEYHILYEKIKNTRKVFHILSKKYHPDKNIGNVEWANAMFQTLTDVHDESSKRASF